MPIQIVPRQAWLNMLKDYYVTESFTIDDIKVNVYDHTAVVIVDVYTKGNCSWTG